MERHRAKKLASLTPEQIEAQRLERNKIARERRALLPKKPKKTKQHRDEYKRAYMQKRRIRDGAFRCFGNMKLRFKNYPGMVNEGKKPFSYYLGCGLKELRQRFATMPDSMTWDNYGKWHMDHIIPICSFDLSKQEEVKKAFHISNIQPRWATANMKKAARTTNELLNNLDFLKNALRNLGYGIYKL